MPLHGQTDWYAATTNWYAATKLDSVVAFLQQPEQVDDTAYAAASLMAANGRRVAPTCLAKAPKCTALVVKLKACTGAAVIKYWCSCHAEVSAAC